MIIQLSSVENMEVEVSRNSVGCQQGNRFFWFLIFSCNALEMLNYWVWSFFHVCYTKQSTKIYLYTHTHIHAYIQIYCASVYMYPCPKPVCIWVLHSKHSLKDFLSLTHVDLFMTILPPVLRHSEFVRLVLTLPQGVRKCLSYLDAH